MPVWGPNAYLAEKDGRLEHFLDVFSAQRRYIDSYVPSVSPMSADESWEAVHWSMHAPLAGEELQHLYPFRGKLLRAWRLAGFKDVSEFGELFDQFPLLAQMRAPGQLLQSADGLVGTCTARLTTLQVDSSTHTSLLHRCTCTTASTW